jgi:lysophospholipase L1-like esterase
MIPIVLLWIVAAIAIAAVVEWSARRYIRRSRHFVYRPRERTHFRPAPAVFPQLEPSVRIDVNWDGERGGSVPTTGKVFRVLVAGGSAAECYVVDQPTSWPGVVERELGRPECLARLGVDRVHVGNIGKAGVDSGTLAMMLEKVLPNYSQLDAIVLMVGASDVVRWLEEDAPSNRPASQLTQRMSFGERPDIEFGFRPKRTGVAALARRALYRLALPPRFEPAAAKWTGRARLMRANATEIRTEVPDAGIVFDTFEANLRKLLARCRQAAPRVIVVRQPWFEKPEFTAEEEAMFWHGGVGQAYRENVTVFYSSEVLFRLMDSLDRRAAAVADDLGLVHVDLRPAIDMTTEVFYDHYHFTAAGCDQVGRVVARAIVGDQPSS